MSAFFFPASSILNHSASSESNLSHDVLPQDAMYVMSGPVLCGHFWPAPPDHWKVTLLPGLAGTTISASAALRPQKRSLLDAPLTGLMSEMRRIGLGPASSLGSTATSGDPRCHGSPLYWFGTLPS